MIATELSRRPRIQAVQCDPGPTLTVVEYRLEAAKSWKAMRAAYRSFHASTDSLFGLLFAVHHVDPGHIKSIRSEARRAIEHLTQVLDGCDRILDAGDRTAPH